MQNVTKYTIFKTKWGYFGLAGKYTGLFDGDKTIHRVGDRGSLIGKSPNWGSFGALCLVFFHIPTMAGHISSEENVPSFHGSNPSSLTDSCRLLHFVIR